ncbi:hypothetical protein BASA81_003066 [Batrachochytrium salamandrivorans]|nr:hypothetical protein BASA81_003066 [Batrachochytrium salamandrivorans]
MNCQVHQVEVELSSWDHLPDSVRIVLHSILFLRSVGKVSHPKQAQCRPHTSLCYAKLSQFDPQVERAVDLLLRQPPADASTLVLSFYEKKPKTAGLYSLLGAGEEMVYFERFFVSFKLDPVLDLKREEVLLRKVVFRLASVGNVKLLPYSFRGEHPLFEITLQPQPQQQQLPQSQFEDKPPAWFAGLFG